MSQPPEPEAPRPPRIILIAPAGNVSAAETALPAATGGCLLSFTDDEVPAAVEAVVDSPPAAVVLERSFAASPRGGALVNRLRLDPNLRDTEIQVVDPEGDPTPVRTLPPQAIIPSAAGAGPDLTPLDYRGTRQTGRIAFDLGVLVKVDGDPATVVDMSPQGTQVLIAQPLRPDQQVRVWSERSHPAFRCRASVVWVQYELHAGSGGYYRAGLQFIDASGETIDAFCAERARTMAVA